MARGPATDLDLDVARVQQLCGEGVTEARGAAGAGALGGRPRPSARVKPPWRGRRFPASSEGDR
jgi:hypothetical protein